MDERPSQTWSSRFGFPRHLEALSQRWSTTWRNLRSRLPATRSLGECGERFAARYLRKKGFRILTRRLRNRFGEIDLVAIDGRTIVFVEVKTWRFGDEDPGVAVDHEKQRRLTQAALAFLKQHRLLNHSARFDVVSLRWCDRRRKPLVRHFCNAFPPVGEQQWFS